MIISFTPILMYIVTPLIETISFTVLTHSVASSINLDPELSCEIGSDQIELNAGKIY